MKGGEDTECPHFFSGGASGIPHHTRLSPKKDSTPPRTGIAKANAPPRSSSSPSLLIRTALKTVGSAVYSTSSAASSTTSPFCVFRTRRYLSATQPCNRPACAFRAAVHQPLPSAWTSASKSRQCGAGLLPPLSTGLPRSCSSSRTTLIPSTLISSTPPVPSLYSITPLPLFPNAPRLMITFGFTIDK